MTDFERQFPEFRPCPLCKHVPDRPRTPTHAHGRKLHLCETCDLFFVDFAEHVSREEERKRYSLHKNTIDNAGYVARFERLMSHVRDLHGDPRRILDFGCGPGPVLVELLRRRGHETLGYDPYFAPETDLTRPFDIVICTETAEHFRTPGESFAKLASLVFPGGTLALMTSLHPGAGSIGKWWYVQDETHVSFYSLRTFDWIARHWCFELEATDRREIVILRRRLTSAENTRKISPE